MKKRFKIIEDLNSDIQVTKITDTLGNKVITDSTKGLPSKIYVELEATHTGVNKNLVGYTHDGLAKSSMSWTQDFNKPVLLNHDEHSDPLGRVVASEYKQSVIDSSKHCIHLRLEITNKAAIERFLDGRYKTFSIGGHTQEVNCSICNQDIIKDGFCKHVRGQKYEDQLCHWVIGQMDYCEVSVVNMPADSNAQAINILNEEGEPIVSTSNSSTSQSSLGDSVKNPKDDITSQMDSLLNQKSYGITNEQKQKIEDEHREEQFKDLNKILQLTDELNKSKIDNITKDNTIKELTKQTDELKEKLKEIDILKDNIKKLEEEKESLVNQNVSFAKFTHNTLCNTLADVNICLGNNNIEDKDTLISDFSSLTVNELSEKLSNVKQNKRPPIQPVVHPSTAQAGDKAQKVEESAKGSSSTKPSLEDYINSMIEFMVN